MDRVVGTVSRGLRAPIIREGDDLVKIVTDVVTGAEKKGEFDIKDRDVLCMTEAIVARSQGNYVSISDIEKDVRSKFQDETIGLIFPILSRNRFSICLKGIAKAAKKIVLMLSYPSDEVGNALVDMDLLDEKGVSPDTDVLTEEQFIKLFGNPRHTFTFMNYVEYYKELITSQGAEVEVVFANKAKEILKYTNHVLCCDIHTRNRSKRILKAEGATVYGLDDIMNRSIDGSGYNQDYGLLGSNKATEEKVKLFPRDSKDLVLKIQKEIKEKTGKNIEVMVYGDGAFKDPVGKIWELADPVVSPGYTDGLEGTPYEVKLKYLADNDFKDLKGEELEAAMRNHIKNKEKKEGAVMELQGTTPRRLTDLIGSLCDLTSGSGDKGTPIVYIQGYFDNLTTE